MGYYGPGYFYNGIFLGMGPWGGWGYSHGWGERRFVAEGGGNYHGGPGRASYHENGGAVRGGGQVHSDAAVSHGGPRPSAGRQAQRSAPSHASAPRAQASRPSGGGQSHGGGGGSHGGGERK